METGNNQEWAGKRLLFIYNPTAGKGRVMGRLAGILDVFTKAGYLVTAYPTQRPGDATEVAARLAGGYHIVVCCGGDGTLSEVARGLLQCPAPPPLGFLPAGTTNDFARNLNLPRGLERMASAAVAGVPRPCDVGRFNEKSFVYIAAFGAFTDVAYSTSQEKKNLFGHLAYLVEGMGKLGALKGYALTVEHDGGTVQGDFLYGMVGNTVSVGGLWTLAQHEVRLDDGLFEVVLVRMPKNAHEVQSILTAITRKTPDEEGLVLMFHSARLKIGGPVPPPWTLDGEYGGAPEVAEIENLHRALTMIHGR